MGSDSVCPVWSCLQQAFLLSLLALPAFLSLAPSTCPIYGLATTAFWRLRSSPLPIPYITQDSRGHIFHIRGIIPPRL